MCGKCLNRCHYHRNCSCDRCCRSYNYFDNRCDDFLWPMMFLMIRNMNRRCHHNCIWGDRYDRFRC